ncbi:MAG: hypothetical protein ABR970_10515 [Roseiarcus sp.]|jgi:hypothetical protein
MPMQIDDCVITLDGHCAIEEAQPLFDLVRGIEAPIFDVAQAKSLHTAIVQLILASSGKVRGASANPLLSACFRDRELP